MEYQPDLKNITGEGGVVLGIVPNSIAAELGLMAGDAILAINGHVLRDVIDYRFAMADEQIELLVRRNDEETIYEIEKDTDDDLGIEFVEPLFDRLRTCNNKCPFCFLTQMPKGLRKSLYLKDDDFRLGFLYGNFVTFTNLKEEDWQRIEEQRLSPQYISIHATDRTMRAVMLGKPDVPDVLDQIRRLGAMGVSVHAQIVALPGINDGEMLQQSIRELAALYPIVQTIAVVPVGLTKYRFEGKRPQTIKAAIHIHETPEWIDENWERQPLWDEAIGQAGKPSTALDIQLQPAAGQPSATNDFVSNLGHCSRQIVATDVPMRVYRPEEAAQVVDLVEQYQARFREEFGNGLVYPSDEFYLLCSREMPSAERYDGMPQYSNGVGMTRDFLDGWAKAQRRLPARMPRPTELTIVCATLIAPVLQRIVARLNRIEGMQAHLLPVVNQFFGEMVTVSGLLMAQDVIPALKASGATRALLPRVMFDHTGKRTIDEYSLERIAAETGIPVAVAGEPEEVLRYVRALARDG